MRSHQRISMSVCLREHISKTGRRNFAKVSLRVAAAVIRFFSVRRRCDTLCASVLWITSRVPMIGVYRPLVRRTWT